jgi:SpoVK/Ycf46/Vps4 family AAA+-type ATPase
VQLARLLEGYSGSDMRNLCTAAAYVPIRELIAKEDMIQMLQTEGLEGMRTIQLYDEISAADSPRPDNTVRCVVR